MRLRVNEPHSNGYYTPRELEQSPRLSGLVLRRRHSLLFKSSIKINFHSAFSCTKLPLMNAEWVRQVCLSFPGAAEQVTWGSDLTFRIAGKIFAVTVLEVAPVWLSFKCTPENFAELTERYGVIPAPYLARAQWVALETREALAADELARLLRESYDLVFAKLPRKTRERLQSKAHASTENPAGRVSADKKRARQKPKRTKKSR